MTHKNLVALAAVIGVVAISTPATALSYKDILGKWCGVTSNPTMSNREFTRKTLISTVFPAGNKVVVTVDRYEFSPSTVKLYFTYPSGKHANVIYDRFSSDNKKMSQQETKGYGRYTFIRCR